MKKLLFAVLCMLAIVACDNQKSAPVMPDGGMNDSLQKIIEQKDNEINDMMGTLNEIQEGFRAISEAEGRVNVAKAGERADRAQQMRENMQFISQRMAKLQSQLKNSNLKSDELQKTIDGLITELEAKNQQLQQLQADLDTKDIKIMDLQESNNNLNSHVTALQDESAKKTETINNQDKQLNTAWFVFGTKKELKEQGIYDDGKVLRNNFNKNYFTKIDIRIDKEVKLYSKSVKVLTPHPSSSYMLVQDANKQFTLKITNPQIFWSTSKYLVVLVK